MKTKIVPALTFLLFATVSLHATSPEEPLRVIVFGAHPDDCDVNAGGVAALWSEAGHRVKFVSMTDGGKGHYAMPPDELARRRRGEMEEAGRILGVEYVGMDNRDGELMPTLENRLEAIRLIRGWEADIVITHRPNDYHPDHRYCSQIVQDAAYMIAVPLVAPETKALMKPVVFLYMADRFRKPNPFSPDIVVDITPVAQKKTDALCAHVSQLFEWLPWINNGGSGGKPATDVPADREGRRRIGESYLTLNDGTWERAAALKWYSAERLAAARWFEAFEVCEYGAAPSREDIKRLFPMLPR